MSSSGTPHKRDSFLYSTWLDDSVSTTSGGSSPGTRLAVLGGRGGANSPGTRLAVLEGRGRGLTWERDGMLPGG